MKGPADLGWMSYGEEARVVDLALKLSGQGLSDEEAIERALHEILLKEFMSRDAEGAEVMRQIDAEKAGQG